jgi:hypothetical protein
MGMEYILIYAAAASGGGGADSSAGPAGAAASAAGSRSAGCREASREAPCEASRQTRVFTCGRFCVPRDTHVLREWEELRGIPMRQVWGLITTD